MDFLKDILRQYAGGDAGGRTPAAVANDPRSVEDDYARVAEAGHHEDLAAGLAEAFRSDRTPPFPAMLAQLFGRSPANQRAGILNTLLSALGPSVLGNLLGLGEVLGVGRSGEVTPEMAEQVPPAAVEKAAEHAEQKDPSIIERLGRLYADQPQLVKTLGAAALAIARAKVAQRKGTL
jgi:hypothetical protein